MEKKIKHQTDLKKYYLWYKSSLLWHQWTPRSSSRTTVQIVLEPFSVNKNWVLQQLLANQNEPKAYWPVPLDELLGEVVSSVVKYSDVYAAADVPTFLMARIDD